MLLLSRVCAEFHDRNGAVLFDIKPDRRMTFIEAPESIRQDPLFDMLVHDGSLEIPADRLEQRKLESDPAAGADATGRRIDAADPGSEPARNKRPVRGSAAPADGADKKEDSGMKPEGKTETGSADKTAGTEKK